MRRFRRWAAVALAALLAGCETAPPPKIAKGARTVDPAPAAAAGEVIGRSARFVIVLPEPGDTWRSIAQRFLGSASRDWMIAEFNASARPEPGEPVVVPLVALDPIGVRPNQIQTVPILCYHRFGQGGGKMSVSPANFAAQLDWLAKNDYRVIRLEELTAFLEGRQALPRRSVVITIDDGYESVARHALPLLRRYGFPATVFVYTDFIGAGDALSWNQLGELAASGLVDIQSHSKTHRNLIERTAGETDAAYRQSIEAEVRVPKELLERRLPVQVRQLAYPYGDVNEQVLDELVRQRFQLALTVNPGGNAFYAQPLMLRRTMIFGDHDLETFKAKLQISRPFAIP